MPIHSVFLSLVQHSTFSQYRLLRKFVRKNISIFIWKEKIHHVTCYFVYSNSSVYIKFVIRRLWVYRLSVKSLFWALYSVRQLPIMWFGLLIVCSIHSPLVDTTIIGMVNWKYPVISFTFVRAANSNLNTFCL